MSQLSTTAISLAIGALGAAMGFYLGLPVFILTGPAILVAFSALFGIRFGIHPFIWNTALLFIGIGIGAGVNNQAAEAFLRWPLAFAALGLMLVAIMASSSALLMRIFGYDRHSAVLAATPGHLSLVLSLADDLNRDVARISTVQSVRLLALTLLVPFTAQAFGMELGQNVLRPGTPMSPVHLAMLAGGGLIHGLLLKRMRIPAPFLIGGLLISTLTHASDLTPGILPPWLALPGFLVVGTMIGSRFSGITIAQLRRDGLAGLLITLVAVALATLAAWPVSVLLQVPLAHVVVAFAPGGLETMATVGLALGADPGFIAASHVARLFMLLFILPMLLGRKMRD